MLTSRELLHRAWSNEQVLLLNGLVFPDGRYKELLWDGERIQSGSDATWAASNLSERITYFTELCRVEVPAEDLVVVAGEGGLGGDGVIALVERSTNLLRWVLFIDSSNPFEAVVVTRRSVVATTTLGTKWRLDLDSPDDVSVELLPKNDDNK